MLRHKMFFDIQSTVLFTHSTARQLSTIGKWGWGGWGGGKLAYFNVPVLSLYCCKYISCAFIQSNWNSMLQHIINYFDNLIIGWNVMANSLKDAYVCKTPKEFSESLLLCKEGQGTVQPSVVRALCSIQWKGCVAFNLVYNDITKNVIIHNLKYW